MDSRLTPPFWSFSFSFARPIGQLKEEKQLRWAAEDTLADLRRKYDHLRETALQRKAELAEVAAEVEATNAASEQLQLQLRDKERECSRLRKDLERQHRQDEAQDTEEAIAQAYRQSWQDKVLRQEAEERLRRVLAQIELHQPGASGVLLEQVDSGMHVAAAARSGIEATDLEETSW